MFALQDVPVVSDPRLLDLKVSTVVSKYSVLSRMLINHSISFFNDIGNIMNPMNPNSPMNHVLL